MENLIARLINGEVGLCIVDEDKIPDVNEEELERLAELLNWMVQEGEITLYDYPSPYHYKNIVEYLHDQLRSSWTHLFATREEKGIPMLVGCKDGYFKAGSGKGHEVFYMQDFLAEATQHMKCTEDEKELKFDSVF